MRIFDARLDGEPGSEPSIIDYHQEAVTSLAVSVRLLVAPSAGRE